MRNIELLAEFDLCSQPDTVKPFPSHLFPDSVYSGTFLVGTYRYDQKKNERDGGLLCFNPCNYLKQKLVNDTTSHTTPTFHEFGKELSGVLGCSWINRENSAGILCLTADSKVVQFDATCGKSEYEWVFRKISEIRLQTDLTSVGLSLTLADIYGRCMSVTSSSGYVYVIKDHILTHRWKAHDLEVWTSVFDPNNTNVVFTGSDDSYIKVFDLRDNIKNPTKISRHSSGVTTLQFSPSRQNILYSGGFDKNLFQFDIRNISTPVNNTETHTSIWYIDFVKDHKIAQLHIAGCYDGAVVYDFINDEINLESYMRYNNSLVYAVSHTNLDNLIYCSCSFYQKKIKFYHVVE